ncbi:MAG: ribosome biogenesis GTPase Der [Patescibacteria group bacterium]
MNENIKLKQLPIAAIIGRTNVGKSTLFNRILEESKAIVSPIAGTTRDVIYGTPIWRGKTFALVDTAGLDISGTGELEKNVLKQIDRAKREAQILLLVLDIKSGIMPEDRKLLAELTRQNKPFLIIANKADNLKSRNILFNKEWNNIPAEKIIPVSAKNGAGVGDLLDEIFNIAQKNKIEFPDSDDLRSIKVSIVGKPNVGKSSLLNSLLRKEVAVVSNIPHTTREPQDIVLEYKGENITLIDTAGIRKRARVEAGFEKVGVRKSINAIKSSDIVLLVLDVSEPMGAQDKKLADLIFESKKGLIIVANKIDLIKSDDWHKKFTDYLQRYFPFLDWAPVIFASALTTEKVNRIYDKILEVNAARNTKIDTKSLEAFIKGVTREHKPLKAKGVHHPYIFGIKQVGAAPPKFFIFIKEKTSVHDSYLKFLSKKIREQYGLEGTPLILETENIRV